MKQRRPQGTGSVFQAHDGWWWAAVYVGSRRVRKRRPTRELAEAACAEIIEQNRNEVGRMYHLVRTGQWTHGVWGWERREQLLKNKNTRRVLSATLRFEILQRDGFRCAYCGATSETATLVVDHIVPLATGGTNDPTNLTTACETCNAGKNDNDLRVLPARLSREIA